MKLIAIAYLLTYFLLSFNMPVNFVVLSSTVFPNTARSTSSKYTIQLGAVIPFKANFEINATFPSAFRLQSLTACQLSINGNNNQSTTCTLNSKQNTINFKTLLSLAFNTATALYASFFAIDLEQIEIYIPWTLSKNYYKNQYTSVLILQYQYLSIRIFVFLLRQSSQVTPFQRECSAAQKISHLVRSISVSPTSPFFPVVILAATKILDCQPEPDTAGAHLSPTSGIRRRFCGFPFRSDFAGKRLQIEIYIPWTLSKNYYKNQYTSVLILQYQYLSIRIFVFLDLEYNQPRYRDILYGSSMAPINIVNAPITCKLTSDVVGAAVNFTLAYSPSVFISPGSILKVDFPPWSAYKLTNFPNASSSSVCSSQCTISSPNSVQSFSSQILTYSSLYPNQSTSNMTLTLSKARNPASTQPITITATLLYSRSTYQQLSYMSCSTTFSASTPNQFKSVSFGPTSYAISQSSVGSLSLSLANPISSITQLMISFSSDLNITFKSKITNQGTIPQALPTGNPNSILIGNLTNSANSFSPLNIATFNFRNAPYGNYPLQVTFTTMNPVGNRFYAIDTTTLEYTFNTSQITSASVTALHNYVGAVTYLIFTFTSINQLIPESKVILTLPPQIVPTKSSSCFCSISFSTCAQLNTTSFLITLKRVVSGGTAFVIYLREMRNPATTTPTSPFSLTTYYYNTSTPTDVLKRIVTLTAKPVPLHSASVASSSLVADSPTNKVDFTNRDSLHSKSATTTGTFPAEFSKPAEVPLKRQYSKPKGPSNIFLRRKHKSY